MNTEHGAYVFLTAEGDATLVMYRRLTTSYLMATCRRREAVWSKCTYADVLDVVPVRAKCVPGMRMPLFATLEETLDAWFSEAYECLRRDLFMRT